MSCPVLPIFSALQLWVVLATMFTGHEFPAIIPFGATSKTVFTAPTHTVFKSCERKLKRLLKRSRDTLHDTVDNFVVRLEQIHEVERSHIERMFT